jgi:hypothetical protein
VIHEFGDASRKVLVAWTDSGTETIDVPGGAVVDIVGRPVPADAEK